MKGLTSGNVNPRTPPPYVLEMGSLEVFCNPIVTLLLHKYCIINLRKEVLMAELLGGIAKKKKEKCPELNDEHIEEEEEE